MFYMNRYLTLFAPNWKNRKGLSWPIGPGSGISNNFHLHHPHARFSDLIGVDIPCSPVHQPGQKAEMFFLGIPPPPTETPSPNRGGE